MKLFFTAIKYDYLQRTRSYAFLITLCASLAIAYTFVPEPNANYSTLRIDNYVGYYNSAWFGYVTAIMSSVFISMIGFYLINSGIKTDSDTKIGQIIATTPVSNFKYLLYKTFSNFLLLLTIVGIVFLMSIVLFILYNDGYSFELYHFVKPYILITIPAVFFVAAIAVLFEVLFGKYTIIQNMGYFFLFSALMFSAPKDVNEFAYDVFGSKVVIHQMEGTVQEILQSEDKPGLNIGYVFGNTHKTKRFEFNGVDFPTSFVLSRLIWIMASVLILALLASFFHRFDRKAPILVKKRSKEIETPMTSKGISLSKLSLTEINYSIFPLLKMELMLLFRKGKKWQWFINFAGMVVLAVLPIKIAHQIVLPILWFLQVGRLSDLTIKEQINNVHYFAYASYKPLKRLLSSQLLSGVIMMLFLALPIIIRQGLLLNFTAVLSEILGGIFIVVLASFLGILTKGKKLFEVLFFMIAYANINGIPWVDYFGGFTHHNYYIAQLILLIMMLVSVSFFMKNEQLNK